MIKKISYFIKVAQCGNITKAANELFISQPSLSVAIKQLEKIGTSRCLNGVAILFPFRQTGGVCSHMRNPLCMTITCSNRRFQKRPTKI